jgi:hypothetical protein
MFDESIFDVSGRPLSDPQRQARIAKGERKCLNQTQLFDLLEKAQPQIVAAVRARLLGTIVVSALTLAWVPPAVADDVAIRIMTQNVYQGTNFDEAFAAQTPAEFVAAVTLTYNNILATDPAERAAAVANEIASQQPDLLRLRNGVDRCDRDPGRARSPSSKVGKWPTVQS